jgi:CsoR family transcriptional regulator, copper-sensing transcriptional repressor
MTTMPEISTEATENDSSIPLQRPEHQKDVVNRLRRIEGQVRGVVEMIQDQRSCEEIALQMSAVRKAMDRAFYRMMACTLLEAVTNSETEYQAQEEIEKATRLLEKFS